MVILTCPLFSEADELREYSLVQKMPVRSERAVLFRNQVRREDASMNKATIRRLHCAVYTPKSSEEGLDQEFNSLNAYAQNHFFDESHN
jgi:hypothetical protein